MTEQPTANIDPAKQHDPAALRSAELPPVTILPIIEAAEDTFGADLPGLLATHPGQWVAYHGRQQLAFASTKSELYEQLMSAGFAPTELLVRRVRARAEEIVVPTRFLD